MKKKEKGVRDSFVLRGQVIKISPETLLKTLFFWVLQKRLLSLNPRFYALLVVLPAWLTRKFRLESRTYCLLPHWNIETKSWPKKPESKKRLLLVFYTAQRIEALERKLTGSLKPSVTSIHVLRVQTNEKSLLSEIPILSSLIQWNQSIERSER